MYDLAGFSGSELLSNVKYSLQVCWRMFESGGRYVEKELDLSA